MISLKAVVLPQQRKANGTVNIKIRVTKDRKTRYISTPFFATDNDLKKDGEIKNVFFVDETNKMIMHFRQNLYKFGFAAEQMAIDEVIDVLQKADTIKLSLCEVFADAIKKLHADATKNQYRCTLKSFLRHIDKEDEDINCVTSLQINSWKETLTESCARNYVRIFSTIYNNTRKQYNNYETGEVLIPHDVFSRVEIPTVKSSERVTFDSKTIRMIWQYSPLNDCEERAKDIFFISFCLIGMNLADIAEVEKLQLKENVLTYERKKTRRLRQDNALIKVEINDFIMQMIAKYNGKKKLFDFGCQTLSNLTSAVNKGLAMIAGELGLPRFTLYTARHSWATIAINECQIDKYTVHKALNHIDQATKITDVYIRKDFTDINSANKKVIGLCYVSSEKKG